MSKMHMLADVVPFLLTADQTERRGSKLYDWVTILYSLESGFKPIVGIENHTCQGFSVFLSFRTLWRSPELLRCYCFCFMISSQCTEMKIHTLSYIRAKNFWFLLWGNGCLWYKSHFVRQQGQGGYATWTLESFDHKFVSTLESYPSTTKIFIREDILICPLIAFDHVFFFWMLALQALGFNLEYAACMM